MNICLDFLLSQMLLKCNRHGATCVSAAFRHHVVRASAFLPSGVKSCCCWPLSGRASSFIESSVSILTCTKYDQWSQLCKCSDLWREKRHRDCAGCSSKIDITRIKKNTMLNSTRLAEANNNSLPAWVNSFLTAH